MKAHLILSLLLGFLLLSCEQEKEEPKTNEIEGELVSHTKCGTAKQKSITNTPKKPRIDYSFNSKEQTLKLKHFAAAVNCCYEELNCVVKREDNTIIIEENELMSSCNCLCVVDLEIEITGVQKQKYTLKFLEKYAKPDDTLIFEIDLNAQEQGSHEIDRSYYPWSYNTK